MPTEEQLPEFVRDSLPRPLRQCRTVITSATPAAHSSPPRRPPPAPGDAAAGTRRRSAEVLQQLSHARNVLLSNLAAPPPAVLPLPLLQQQHALQKPLPLSCHRFWRRQIMQQKSRETLPALREID